MNWKKSDFIYLIQKEERERERKRKRERERERERERKRENLSSITRTAATERNQAAQGPPHWRRVRQAEKREYLRTLAYGKQDHST